jgi:hypothetical protein
LQAILVAQPDHAELSLAFSMPALLALAKAVADRQQLLLAGSIGANDDQDALTLMLEPGAEIDAVRPDIDLALR